MTKLLWTIAFLAGSLFFLFQIYGRFKVLFGLMKNDGRDYSAKSLAARIKNTLIYAFGQKKFFTGDQPAGAMHIVIFWGFVVLFIQVVTMFTRGWLPEFHVPGFGPEGLGPCYAFLKDIFQAAVIVAVGIALFRWAVVKPQRLYGILPAEKRLNSQSHWEAYLILFFIAGIMLSGFFYDAGRIAFAPDHPDILAERDSQPISLALSGLFKDNVDLAFLVMTASWWIHNLIILTFLNLLPRSKHFHIITAVANVFLGKVEPYGKLPKRDLSSDNPFFGRSMIHQFTWKQAFDMYSCTECGRCSAVCPATATNKPLAPRQFLLDLRDTLYATQPAFLKATAPLTESPVVVGPEGDGKPVLDEVVWSCNACRACENACPVNIEYVDKIMDIRQHLVQEASRFPAELNRTFQGLERNSNPWGIAASERAAWADGLDVPTVAQNPNAEYLYYVGCGGSFDSNHKKSTQSLVKILKAAGVSFAIMGSDETCNGETARRLGNEYLYQTMAEALAQKINATGIKKLLVNCPHCFNTMKHEYPDFGGNWKVENAASFVKKLVEQGKLKINGQTAKRIVYHDSCYYARFNDVTEEPRELLGKSATTPVQEMDLNGKNAMCCGAGGGRVWIEEKADQRVNVARTEQALAKNPEVIATSCPFCRIMIGSGVNEKGLGEQVQVMDVMEIVSQNLQA